MPMKLNVGLSRKVGEPNYGSRGATVNLELEVDSTLVAEPDRLQDRIRELFGLAKMSIDEELQVDPSQPAASQQRSTDRTAMDQLATLRRSKSSPSRTVHECDLAADRVRPRGSNQLRVPS